MLVFATSDKGGTGRSVTTCNIAYRSALQGRDACYLDFDFGSPTAGAIFGIPAALRGVKRDGLHTFLRGDCVWPVEIDVWDLAERPALRGRPDGAGALTLLPGDEGGSEFAPGAEVVKRCVRLFSRLEEEYALTFVDLSAGRSHALEVVLAATAQSALKKATTRWLVYHRWTQQHIIAAHGLVHGAKGLINAGKDNGHDPKRLREAIRFVRTAVVNPDSDASEGLRAEQTSWLREINQGLHQQADRLQVGNTSALGQVPLDPVLQWREQILSDLDTMRSMIANQATVDAFELLAKSLYEEDAWEAL